MKVRDNIELHQMTKVASNAAYWKQRVGPAKTIQSRNQGVVIRDIICFIVLLLICTCTADVFALDCAYINKPNLFIAKDAERLGKVYVVNNQNGYLYDTLLAFANNCGYPPEEVEPGIFLRSDFSAKNSNYSEFSILSLMLYSPRQNFVSQSALASITGYPFINTSSFDGVLAALSAPEQKSFAIVGACIIALPFLRRLKKAFQQA